MALELETGDLSNALAETYCDLDFIDAYFEERDNPEVWTCLNVDQKEASVRYATLYLETAYEFKGCLEDVTQPLNFPRTAFYDNQGRRYAGTGVIPLVIQQAVAELALKDAIEPLFYEASPSSPRVISESVGDHSIQFKDAPSRHPKFRLISRMLKPYIEGSNSVIPMRRG